MFHGSPTNTSLNINDSGVEYKPRLLSITTAPKAQTQARSSKINELIFLPYSRGHNGESYASRKVGILLKAAERYPYKEPLYVATRAPQALDISKNITLNSVQGRAKKTNRKSIHLAAKRVVLLSPKAAGKEGRGVGGLCARASPGATAHSGSARASAWPRGAVPCMGTWPRS
eukprot:6205733-Pleurochrysis_carterae.AAC.1